MHLQFFSIVDPYICVGLSFCLLALSNLKSLTLWGLFVVKVEMSCSRAGLSNPALYASQPRTPYLLLTASNWNCDHIFHTVPQPRSLLDSASFTLGKGVIFFFLSCFSLCLSLLTSLFSSGFLAAFRDVSVADPDIVLFSLLQPPRLTWVDWTVHLLRLKTKKDRVDLRLD